MTRRDAWFDLLADVFGLCLAAMAPEARDRLWATVLAAHRPWEASRASSGR